MYKQQKEVCDDLRATNFRNQPKPESFTNHHWTHVVIKSETWKHKNPVKISQIVPFAKDINKELDKLEKEMKELIHRTRNLKEVEKQNSWWLIYFANSEIKSFKQVFFFLEFHNFYVFEGYIK